MAKAEERRARELSGPASSNVWLARNACRYPKQIKTYVTYSIFSEFKAFIEKFKKMNNTISVIWSTLYMVPNTCRFPKPCFGWFRGCFRLGGRDCFRGVWQCHFHAVSLLACRPWIKACIPALGTWTQGFKPGQQASNPLPSNCQPVHELSWPP